MSSPWSLEYKRRMMQLKYCIKDTETGELYFGNPGETHWDIFDKMNMTRMSNGLPVLDLPDNISADDWEGRGYIHKETGRFMTAAEAAEWAEPQLKNRMWGGESLHLRSLQKEIEGGYI